jgi:hypothetical protein
MIEVLSATVCLLGGVDPIDPTLSCLDVNPQTNKLGLAPTTDDPQLGGMLGMTTQMIGTMYTPTTSTNAYVHYISQNFGIVKTAQAQVNANDVGVGYGFAGLTPLLELWKATRNIAYMFLTLAFIFIGLGVMLRVKIDPRTVMTIQNQIPRIVICIMLITFSYAIAAVMIDMMWTTTYVGINVLTATTNPKVEGKKTVSSEATESILQTPLIFGNQIFDTQDAPGGIAHLTESVSRGLSFIVKDMIGSLFGVKPGDKCVDIGNLDIDIGKCVANAFGFVIKIIMRLIVFVAIIFLLFRIWWRLIQAYTFVILYVIVGPIWIVFGLLPGRPLGFEKWMRAMFANLAVFPLTVSVFVAAAVFMELFQGGADTVNQFIPPLVGNPNMPAFGSILAFGMLMTAPKFLDILKESMKAQGNKHAGGAILKGVAAGAAPFAVGTNKISSALNKRDQMGHPVGYLAERKQAIGNKVFQAGAKTGDFIAKRGKWVGGKWIGGKMNQVAAMREHRQDNYGSAKGFDKKAGVEAYRQRHRDQKEDREAKKWWKKEHKDEQATQQQKTDVYRASQGLPARPKAENDTTQKHPLQEMYEARHGQPPARHLRAVKNDENGDNGDTPPPAGTGGPRGPQGGPSQGGGGEGAAAQTGEMHVTAGKVTVEGGQPTIQGTPPQGGKHGEQSVGSLHVGTLTADIIKASVMPGAGGGQASRKTKVDQMMNLLKQQVPDHASESGQAQLARIGEGLEHNAEAFGMFTEATENLKHEGEPKPPTEE